MSADQGTSISQGVDPLSPPPSLAEAFNGPRHALEATSSEDAASLLPKRPGSAPSLASAVGVVLACAGTRQPSGFHVHSKAGVAHSLGLDAHMLVPSEP